MSLPSIPRLLPPLPKLDPSRLLHFPNSSDISLLPIDRSMIYLKLMRNYITSSMLSSLSTSPTTILKKFESDRSNLLIASSNSPSTKGSNNKSNLWCEKNADENYDHEPLLLHPPHGTPQDPLNPIDKILHLYNDMWTSTTHGMSKTTVRGLLFGYVTPWVTLSNTKPFYL